MVTTKDAFKNKVHFSYEPHKDALKRFAQYLIQDIGQTTLENAEIIVSIGGDGSLLHTFRKAHDGQKIFGLVPPESNSQGFWTNRDITSSQILLDSLEAAQEFQVNPLQAQIKFKDGSSQTLHAFNEIMPSENSGQAMLVELKVKGSGETIGPIRIMGDGLIIATAFGSTAINRTYGGPSIDIRNAGISLTGKGIYEPQGGFYPIIAADNSCFEIKFLSPNKRLVRLQYDGLSLNSEIENPFNQISIKKNKDHAVKLLLMNDPSTRAFSAMTPV